MLLLKNWCSSLYLHINNLKTEVLKLTPWVLSGMYPRENQNVHYNGVNNTNAMCVGRNKCYVILVDSFSGMWQHMVSILTPQFLQWRAKSNSVYKHSIWKWKYSYIFLSTYISKFWDLTFLIITNTLICYHKFKHKTFRPLTFVLCKT